MRLLAASAAAAAAVAALGLGFAFQARSDLPGSIEIDAAPVEIAPTSLNGLRLRGAVELSSDHPAFGGLSGMLVDGGTLLAVTDRGWLLRGGLAEDRVGLRPIDAEIAPLLDEAGAPLRDDDGDAESLAWLDARPAIGFERDHRVVILEGHRPAETIHDARFERLPFNGGLEALASLPDGRLVAIGEKPQGGRLPVFLLDASGVLATGTLPQSGPHLVTGADVGPDGRLYLLKRDFSLLTGLSIRIERYRIGPEGLPRPETGETLAAFDGASGIDNMEAIAVRRDGAATRLAILSDDNFMLLQRTLLIDFEVLD